MKVHWTETAQAHLDAIYVYISRDSPEYALRMVDSLTRRSQQLADLPLSGRKVPEFETENVREVIEGAYRVIYHVKPDMIEVLAVIHGSQDILRAKTS
ncbi:MAG: type II toxin-antitoxin system RelE/ParE family toxin [Chloroflexi bacterium]|nr:type II toxin-antitoxin system RelE/ParE family toxin [Chloroflexota bacterium]